MKIYLKYLASIIILTTVIKCSNEYPDSVWNPEYESGPTPVINNVLPEDGGIAGVGIITINGEHFASNVQDNSVYFNGQKGTIISASSTTLVVKAATVVSDSVVIKVRVRGAYELGVYNKNYRLIDATTEISSINNFVEAFGLACDASNNIYVLDKQSLNILKIAHPDSPAVLYGSTGDVAFASGMKTGPDGYVYFLSGRIYRTPPVGGEFESYASFSRSARMQDMDFDKNKNLFAAGLGGSIAVIKPDQTMNTVSTFDDHQFYTLKVYDDYIYLSAKYSGTDTTEVQEGIWRIPILNADGELGEYELYFDWYSYRGEEGPEIVSMSMDENGAIYLGHPANDDNAAISVIQPDKSVNLLYPEILTPPIIYMTWGNDKALYINRHNQEDPDLRRVFKVAMQVNGATYFGRE